MAILDLSTQAGRDAANARDKQYQQQFTPPSAASSGYVPVPTARPSSPQPTARPMAPSSSVPAPAQQAASKFGAFGGASTVGARKIARQNGEEDNWRAYMPGGAMYGKPVGQTAQPISAYNSVPTPPPPMDMNAINSYVDKQIGTKLTAAENAANQTRTTAQTDAQQSTTLLDNQLAQAIARLQASRQQATTGVQTGYDRAQALTRDNRVLQDGSFQRQANPFSGSTDYKQAMIGREREISDRQQTEDLNSRLGSINQDAQNQQGAVEQDVGARKAAIQQNLTNLQNNIATNLQALKDATGAEKERLTREITKDERNYQLQLQEQDRADVLANATLYQQDWQRQYQQGRANREDLVTDRNYDLDLSKYADTKFDYEDTKTYNRNRDAKNDVINADNTAYNRSQDKMKNDLTLRNQHIQEAQYFSDKYGVPVDPKDDFQLVLDQVAGLPTVAQKTAAQKAEDTKRSEAWKIVDFLGTVPEGYADLLGVPAGTQSQKAKEAAMDAAFKSRAQDVAERNAGTAAYNAQTSRMNAERQQSSTSTPKPTANQVEGELIGRIQQMSPDMQKVFFSNEEANLVSSIGRTAYNALRKRFLGEE